MADLRAIAEAAGGTNVRTLLNSGNVVFDAPASLRSSLASRLEAGIVERVGFHARVFVIDRPRLDAIVEGNPLLDVATNPSRLLVAFVPDEARLASLAPLVVKDWGPERLVVGRHAAYAWMPDGVVDSAVMKAMGVALRDATTTRNWATVLKLQALMTQGG